MLERWPPGVQGSAARVDVARECNRPVEMPAQSNLTGRATGIVTFRRGKRRPERVEIQRPESGLLVMLGEMRREIRRKIPARVRRDRMPCDRHDGMLHREIDAMQQRVVERCRVHLEAKEPAR